MGVLEGKGRVGGQGYRGRGIGQLSRNMVTEGGVTRGTGPGDRSGGTGVGPGGWEKKWWTRGGVGESDRGGEAVEGPGSTRWAGVCLRAADTGPGV